MTYEVEPIATRYDPQTAGLAEFEFVAELSPSEIVDYFRDHPEAATRVVGQSEDKRGSPSTFFEENQDGYQVGWFDQSRQHVQRFKELPEAVADYLLFSFSKGRLKR